MINDSKTVQKALSTLNSELNPDYVLPDYKPEYRKLLATGLLYKVGFLNYIDEAPYETVVLLEHHTFTSQPCERFKVKFLNFVVHSQPEFKQNKSQIEERRFLDPTRFIIGKTNIRYG